MLFMCLYMLCVYMYIYIYIYILLLLLSYVVVCYVQSSLLAVRSIRKVGIVFVPPFPIIPQLYSTQCVCVYIYIYIYIYIYRYTYYQKKQYIYIYIKVEYIIVTMQDLFSHDVLLVRTGVYEQTLLRIKQQTTDNTTQH